MKALIYRDFSESYETREIGNGKIKDVLPEYPEDKYAVLVNGIRRGRDFEILPGDIVAVRSIPHLTTGLLIAGAIVAGVSAITAGVVAYKAKKQAQRAQEEAEKLADSLSSSSSSVTQDPTLPGASNTTATGKTQPYIMGRRLWTPYFVTDEWDDMRGSYWQEAVTVTLNANLTLSVSRSVQKRHGDEIYKYSASVTLEFLSDWGGETDVNVKLSSEAKRSFTIKKGETYKAGDKISCSFQNLLILSKSVTVAGESYSFDVSYSDKTKASETKEISKVITLEEAHYEKDNSEYNFRVLQAGFVSQAIEEVRADDETLIEFDPPVTSAECAMSSTLFSDSRIEIRQDGDAFSDERFTYKMDVQEVDDELKLADDDSYEDLIYTLPSNTKEVYIPLEFPSGLYTTNDDGARIKRTITTLTEYSTDGGETYSTLGTQFGRDGVIESKQRTDLYFILRHTFTDSEILNAVQTSTPIKIRISCLTNEVTSGSACDSMQIVKIRSRLIDSKKARKNGTVEYEPLLEEKIDALSVKIGLCLKATSTNQDKAGKIQIVTCGMARVWDSETRAWSETREATRNPAAWLLETLTSRTHPASQLSDDEIDLESMGDFYEYCDENELHIDLVVNTGDTKENILKKILETGNAGLYRSIYGKVAVAIDDKKENAIAVLNQQNLVSFSAEKNLTRNTDGYRVTFTENGYWEEDTQVFMRDGSDYADAPADTQIEELTIENFTADSSNSDFSQVYKYIRRKINADILRAHSYSLEIGKEGYFFPLYSRVKITHPALCAGLGSSTIKSVVVSDGKITGLNLCSPVQYSSGARYGAVIQCVTKTYSRILSAEYVALSSEPTFITLAEPIDASAETVPQAGNILSYGTLSDDGTFETITNEMTVTEIKPSTNGFQLTGVDYSDDLFEYGTIPEYECNITKPRGSLGDKTITNDDVLDEADRTKNELEKLVDGKIVESDETPADVSSVSAVAGKDGITLSAVAGGSTIYDSARNFIYQISRDSGESWEDVDGSYYTFDRSVDGYPEKTDFGTYIVRAKTVNAYGNQSENWKEAEVTASADYKTWKAPAVEVSYLTAGKDGLKAVWTSDTSLTYGDVRYKVEFLYDGETVQTTAASMVAQGEYTFDRDSDKDGYPEKSSVNAKLTELGIETKGRSVELYSVKVSAYTLQKTGDFETSSKDCSASNYGTWVPGTNTKLTAKAGQDGITAEMETSPASTEYGTPYRYEFGIRKSSDGDWTVSTSDSSIFTYSFSGEYPESSELSSWGVRCRAVSVCGLPALSYRETAPDTTGYGTWLLDKPSVATRVSDRSITLIMSQPSKSLEQYGTTRYKIQIRRPGDDEEGEWFKPGLTLDPYASEDNYKDGSGYIETGSVYVQTMPLKGQSEKSLCDTLYQFRITAVNEAHESEANGDVFATALCTSIADIVKANETAKSAYISELSSITANLGTIRQGSMAGNDNNYWNLSTLVDSTTGEKRWQGAMRVGGDDQYLAVVPKITNGEITGYDISFKVGSFEISSTASNINGELVVMKNSSSLDRTRITPEGTFYEHRETVSSSWVSVSEMTTAGILTSLIYSEKSLVITNMSVQDRRKAGHDIGRPYLSKNSHVWHFDTDLYDQNQETTLEISSSGELSLVGSETSGNLDYTPAILAVAPYSEIAKSLFGQYTLKADLGSISAFTVDFWMEYIWCEDQILFEAGTRNDKVRMTVAQKECYWNEPADDEAVWNSETKETGDVVVWNEPGDASTTLIHYGQGHLSPGEDNIKTFSQLGIAFEPNSWLHIGIVMTEETLSVFIGKTEIAFDRYEKTAADVSLTLNVDGDTLKNSFVLDELMIDATEPESFSDFSANTDARIPWGALDSSEKHFILDADGLVTNIFGSDSIKAIEADVETNTGNITSVQASVKTNAESISEIESSVKTNADAISALEERIKALEEKSE